MLNIIKKVFIVLLVSLFSLINGITSFAMSNSEIQSKILSILYDNGGRVNCDFDGYVNTSGRHEGIDFYSGYGKTVNSITDGVVVRVVKGSEGSSGLSTISIYNSKYNKSIVYLHTSPVANIKAGDMVYQGEKIATESWRGISSKSGTHTHIEIRNGRTGYAAKSVGDNTLDNDNPYPFYKEYFSNLIDNNNYLDIGSYFYANIIQRDNWATVVNNDGSVEIGKENGYANELWWFERQNDGSYYIQSMLDNRYLDVDNAKTDNGTTIKVWDYSGMDAQKWYIKNGEHGYVIYPKNAIKSCLDCTNASTSVGTKIQLWEQNGTAAQGFSIYKQGNFRFYDLGDTFYAPLLNTDSWKPLLNSNRNLILGACDTNNSDVLWQFKRNSDGTYTISSCLDGSCLDVLNSGSAEGTPVGLCTPNNSNAQRWYIGMYENGWLLKPKCAPDCVLDLIDNNTSFGNGFQLYSQNNSGAQKFSIYRGEESQLRGAVLNAVVGNSASNTIFTWNDVYGETRYDVKIWKNNLYEGDAYHIEWGAKSGYEINLPAGTYQAYVDASNYFDYKMSNVITFTVRDEQYTIYFDANGGNTKTTSKTVTYNSTYGELPTPTRNGYEFKGWYTSNDSGECITSSSKVQIKSNLTLYARWNEIFYTITYDVNGGVELNWTELMKYSETVSVSNIIPTRVGYRFMGWSKNNNATVAEYKPNDLYSEIGDVVLYAVWRIIPYTKTEVTDYGAYKICNVALNYIENQPAIVVASYKNGKLISIEKRGYKNESEFFALMGDFDMVKVMVLDDFDNLIPITKSEEILLKDFKKK